MDKTVVNGRKMLTNEELEKVVGGMFLLGLPNMPYVTVPGDTKEEPKDGGATGVW